MYVTQLLFQALLRLALDTIIRKFIGCFNNMMFIHTKINRRVNEAAKQQMDRIWHTTTCFLNKPTYEYITKLKGKMTGALNVIF